MFDWRLSKGLSGSSIVASTSIWVFLVPALVKLLGTTEGLLSTSTIQLPESMYVLYLSGVSLFLGATTFSIFCPAFIKSFGSYEEFERLGNNCLSLGHYLRGFNGVESQALILKLRLDVEEASPSDIDSGDAHSLCIGVGSDASVFNFRKAELDSVFWVVYDFFQWQKKHWLSVSLAFHFLGYLGLVYLFCMNFYLVVTGVL